MPAYTISASLALNAGNAPISSFEFDAPENVVGARLTVQLTTGTAAGDEVVAFDLAVNGDPARLIDAGRIVETGFVTGLAQRTVRISAVNAIADRWQLAPRVPVVLYDPAQITISTDTVTGQTEVIDENGDNIEPTLREVPDLDLTQVLNFAYVEGCGFSQVITNLETAPIKQVVFGIESTYHSVALAQISIFEPVYFADDDLRLFIIDPQGTLPSGLPVRSLPRNTFVTMNRSKQSGQMVNAVLLTYRDSSDDEGGTFSDFTYPDELHEVGTFGQAGYQRLITRRTVRQFFDSGGRFLHEKDIQTIVRTQAFVASIFRDVIIETTTYSWAYDFSVEQGYTKITQVLTRLPADDTLLMREAQREIKTIVYNSTANPNELRKTAERVQITGTILSVDNPDDPANPTKTSLFTAYQNNDFPEDATVLFNQDIESRVETSRPTGPDQIEVQVQPFNALTSTMKTARTFNHTGSLDVRIGGPARSSTMLFRNEADEALHGFRVPITRGSGDLPFERAQVLAERALDFQGNGPQRVSIQYAGLDLSLRRGSLRLVDDGVDTWTVFITDYRIRGERLGTPQFRISMEANGIVLNA